MIGNKRIACIIPARLKSTRFPRKVLSSLCGKPLLQWVWEAANKTQVFDTVAFAVDSEETAALITSFGGKFYMTAEACTCGTERLIELQGSGLIDADIWVCWQGDEPLISQEMIEDLLQTCSTDTADIWTLKKRIQDQALIASPNTVKVICNSQGLALYFSRSPIPHYRDVRAQEDKHFFKHVGIYAYTAQALQKIGRLPSSHLEEAEMLEQLRWLDHGMQIRVHPTHHEAIGIDVPEQLIQVEALCSRNLSGL